MTSRSSVRPHSAPDTDDVTRSGEYLAHGGSHTAAEAVVDLLCRLGVDTFFGVPGGPVIPLFDAILTRADATLIEPRHEAYGTFEAMGFHRASGRVPAVVVTAGPGATNVVTGLAAAHFERVPMIVLCGDVATSTGGRLLQDSTIAGVGIERMAQGLARAVVRVSRGSSAVGEVQAALRAATAPDNPGPALVVFPVDRSGASASPPRLFAPSPDLSAPPASPDSSVVESIAKRLWGAKRPLIILGAACRAHASRIAALVDAIGVPFTTTPQAKGVVSEEHPLSLRTCGMGASWWARDYLKAGADVTLAIGTDLDDVSVAGTPPIGPGGALVHVSTDPSVFARNFPTEIGAVYDVGAFADALAERFEASGPAPQGASIAAQARARSPFDTPDFASDEALPIAPHRAIADLERAAGSRATFVTDIGEHMLFALHYLTATGPERFTIHLGLGSMGSGIGSAVGQALGDRSRLVICICGDGGMQMAGMELLVAIKHRLRVVFAVFNDARYNMVYHGYRHTFGREARWETPQVDFVRWAESLGACAARIERAGEITSSLLEALTADGPAVLDIRQDPNVRVRGDGRIEAIRQMSMIHRTDT